MTKTCLTGTDPLVGSDAAQITAVRSVIDIACPCDSFDGTLGKTHRAYTRCVAAIIAAQSATPPANLRPQCRMTVKKIYARSTCGLNPALHSVACLQTVTKSGAKSCSIKPTTKQDGATPTNRCSDGRKFTPSLAPRSHTALMPPIPTATCGLPRGRFRRLPSRPRHRGGPECRGVLAGYG